RVSLLVARAAGSPGRALALRDDPQAEQRVRLLERLARLPELSAAALSAPAPTLAPGEGGAALDAPGSWYRDLLGMVVEAGGPAHNADMTAQLRATAARSTLDVVLRQLEAVCDTIDAIERNANRVLAFETLLLVLRRLERGPDRVAAWTSNR